MSDYERLTALFENTRNSGPLIERLKEPGVVGLMVYNDEDSIVTDFLLSDAASPTDVSDIINLYTEDSTLLEMSCSKTTWEALEKKAESAPINAIN